MRGGVTIRAMSEEDLRNVFLLGRELFSADREDPWEEDSLAALLGANMEHSLVAIRRKDIAGFAIPEVTPGTAARIRWVAWRPGEETAVALPLLEALIAYLSTRDTASLRITVDPDNSQLIDILRKIGFTESEHLLIMEHFFPKKQ